MPDAKSIAAIRLYTVNNFLDEKRPLEIPNTTTCESDNKMKREFKEVGEDNNHRSAKDTAFSSRMLMCSARAQRPDNMCVHVCAGTLKEGTKSLDIDVDSHGSDIVEDCNTDSEEKRVAPAVDQCNNGSGEHMSP